MTPELEEFVAMLYQRSPWLREVVQFTGLMNDRETLYEYCARASVICMPSRWESFGIATVEGMAFGAYPVLTNYGSVVYDQTKNETLGIIVRENRPEALAKSLEDALRKSTSEMAARVRSYARERFDYWKLAVELDGFLTTKMQKLAVKK